VIVVPAVDIKNGRCVRLFKGVKEMETVYEEDPLRAAARWAQYPIKRLHVVDLDGAFEGRPKNMPKIIEIIGYLQDGGVQCEVGGGIRNEDTVAEYADAGATRIVVGTIAVQDPELFEDMVAVAPGKVSLGLDCRGEEVLVRGWEHAGGVKLFDLLKRTEKLELGEIIYTEVERDGTGEGLELEMLKRIVEASPHPVIASGGVGSVEDVKKARAADAYGVIIGKALYDGRIDLEAALAICQIPSGMFRVDLAGGHKPTASSQA